MPKPSDTALFPQISHPQKRALLAAYATCGRVTHAARLAKVTKRLHYYWLRDDPVYAAAWQDAKVMVGDFLEEEAIRRAYRGVVRKKYYKDQVIGKERERSDVLLIFLLKGAMPEKYRERFEHTGAQGGPLEIKVIYDEPKTEDA